MIIGRVINNIWCTRKDESLVGAKFLTVKLLDKESEAACSIIVAVDLIGAGIGEKVLITQGSSARRLSGLDSSPVDAIIVGIIDEKSEL